ncbi:hypothetical protein IFM89_013229 [Coptis chinensis]|uniref:MULE transposase domain-containing protein n=1 Tax=Coptis chinensis TaxID=261450 RepID=A0A835INP4_9MAGN|nr:hypothetical protein IFM89_013229 [Coptis chinensis]
MHMRLAIFIFIFYFEGIFPLAIAIVVSETDANWFWFLEQLKLVISSDRILTFLSDRHVGLVKNIPIVFPGSFHSYCLWHLKNNVGFAIRKDKKLRKYVVKLFYDCAYAASHHEFFTCAEKLKKYGGLPVQRFLEDIRLENWANAYFRGARYGEMCSTLAECFNVWITKERFLPITPMLFGIMEKMMEMSWNRLEKSMKWNSVLCPKMEIVLASKVEAARTLRVTKLNPFSRNLEFRKQLADEVFNVY